MEWFEKEDFWVNYAPIMYDDRRWAEAPTVAQKVKDIACLKDGDSVLDAGCGLGRISVELAALNLRVTGVDIIKSELNAAKESSDDENLKIDFIQQDLRYFHPKSQFDCAVNLYTSFGYCDTIDEDMAILKNIADSVKKGGTFIMECTSRESAILYFTEGEWFERAGFTVLTEFECVGAWEGLRSKWTLIDKEGKRIVHEFVQRLYPAAFLRDKLIEFGFAKADVYGDFDFSPYNQNARTMILVGKK